MICNNCGCEIEEGSNFCPYCGAGVYYDTPNVQQPVYDYNMQNGQMQIAVGYMQQLQPNLPTGKMGALPKAFFAISIFNFVNLFLHVFSCFLPFIITELDYVFYAIKIILYFAVCRFIKKNYFRDFFSTVKFLKATIVLDAIELSISIINSDSIIMPWILYILFILKLIVNVLMYLDFFYIIKDEKRYIEELDINIAEIDKLSNSWPRCSFFIVLFIVLAVFSSNFIFLFLASVFLLIRFISELKIIKKTVAHLDGYYDVLRVPKPAIYDNSFFGRMHYRDLDSEKNMSSAKKIYMTCALSMALLFGIFMYFSFDKEDYNDYLYYKEYYAEGKEYEDDVRPDDYIHIYHINNRMPEWTGLRKDKVGFINTKTGMDTGPHYESIRVDDFGFIWNGKDFLDVDGKVIVKGTFWTRLSVSKRQHFLRDLINGTLFWEKVSLVKSFDDWDFGAYYQYKCFFTYDNLGMKENTFRNGVTRFYCDFNECYGLLRKDGTVVAKPIYDYLALTTDRSLALGSCKLGHDSCVMNADGEILIRYDRDSEDVTAYEGGVILYRNEDIWSEDENARLYYMMDNHGNTWDGMYCCHGDTSGICFEKFTGEVYESNGKLKVSGGYSLILVSKGNLIFESDKYVKIKVETNFLSNQITKIIGITKSGEEEVLDIKIH